VDVDGFSISEDSRPLYFNLNEGSYIGESIAVPQTFFLDEAIYKGKSYVFRLFVDMDGDGKCNSLKDHVWSLPIDMVTGHVFLEHVASAPQDPTGCFEP
jgi:hypothetical protein